MPADASPQAPASTRGGFSLGLLANVGGGIWAALVAIVALPVVAGWVGLAAFGLIAFYQVVQMALQLFDMGFSALISRELAAMRATGRTDEVSLFASLEAVYLLIGLVLGAIALVAAVYGADHWIAAGLDPDMVRRSLLCIGVLLAVNWPVTFYYGASQGLGAQVRANGVQAAMSTLQAGGGLLALHLVSATPDVWLAWQLVVAVIRSLALRTLVAARLRGPRPARRSWALVAQHGRFSMGVTLANLPSTLMTHQDKVFLSWFGSPRQFALYYLGSTLGTGMVVLIAPIYQSLLPRLSATVAAGETATASAFLEAGRLAAVLLAPPSIVLAGTAVAAVFVWTGDAEMASQIAPVTALLALGNLLNGLWHVPYALQLAWRWTRPAVILNSVAFLVTCPVTIWAAAHERLALLALTLTAAYAGGLCVSLLITRTRLSFSFYRLTTAVLPAVAAGLAGVIAGHLAAGVDTRGVAALQCLVAGTVAVAATVAFDRVARQYLCRTLLPMVSGRLR